MGRVWVNLAGGFRLVLGCGSLVGDSRKAAQTHSCNIESLLTHFWAETGPVPPELGFALGAPVAPIQRRHRVRARRTNRDCRVETVALDTFLEVSAVRQASLSPLPLSEGLHRRVFHLCDLSPAPSALPASCRRCCSWCTSVPVSHLPKQKPAAQLGSGQRHVETEGDCYLADSTHSQRSVFWRCSKARFLCAGIDLGRRCMVAERRRARACRPAHRHGHGQQHRPCAKCEGRPSERREQLGAAPFADLRSRLGVVQQARACFRAKGTLALQARVETPLPPAEGFGSEAKDVT